MSNDAMNKLQKAQHVLTLDNRKMLSLSGISEVDSFDDRSIVAYTDIGKLNISGENLNIKKLNLEIGELEVEGKISSLIYIDGSHGHKKRSFFRLLKNNS